MAENYEKVLERISRVSNLDKDEIDRRVDAKREKLSGLISKEGAAQVIAAELGISFDNERLKINELLPGMRRVNVVGKIINLFPVRTFVKNGKQGKVANLIIADETSNVRVVLWDTNHIDLIEKGRIVLGRVIEILNATMRENEIHLGSFSDLKLSNENFEKINTKRIIEERNIIDFKINDNVDVRAFIVQIFEPKSFSVCSECKKKLIPEGENFICQEHGKIVPEKRFLINILLDDGTENIRAVLFHESLKGLGFKEEEFEKLFDKRDEILGREMVFSGNVRINKFFNNKEFVIDEAKEVNIDELIENLEKINR